MTEKQPVSQICGEDEKQTRFKKAIDDWVKDEISYDELKRQYPLYPSDGFPWLLQVIGNKLREFNIKSKS